MSIIEKAKKEAKQLVNKAYQVEEIYGKLKSKYNINVYNYDIWINIISTKDIPFNKFKDLFLEEFEEEFNFEYINESLNGYGGFYLVEYKYLDVIVNISFSVTSCKLIEEEVLEKRYRMKC